MAKQKRQAKRKAPLTPQRIVGAAVQLADQHGIDQLTMRELATHLDTGPMSLYNHVANKDDLIDEMVDHIAAEVDLPEPGTPWKPALRSVAVATHQTLQNHPWAFTPWATRAPGPKRYLLLEALLANLAAAELPADIADLGFHAIINHLQSSLQRQQDRGPIAPEDYQQFYESVDAEQLPHLIEHAQFHQSAQPTRDEFTFVLDLILDGLEQATHAT